MNHHHINIPDKHSTCFNGLHVQKISQEVWPAISPVVPVVPACLHLSSPAAPASSFLKVRGPSVAGRVDFGSTLLIKSTKTKAKSCGRAWEQVKEAINKWRKHVCDGGGAAEVLRLNTRFLPSFVDGCGSNKQPASNLSKGFRGIINIGSMVVQWRLLPAQRKKGVSYWLGLGVSK